MLAQIRSKFTYANVVATLALFVALGSGTAFAARAMIDGRNLTNRSVTNAKLAQNSVTGVKVRNGSLSAADLSAAARRALKGATGETGARGETGTPGSPGAAGSTGPRGHSSWDVIPSGVTVTGNFDSSNSATRADGGGRGFYSLQIPLPGIAPAPLTETTVNFAPTAPGFPTVVDGDASCTGTAEAPTAPAGKVCLYAKDAFSGGVEDYEGYEGFPLEDRGFLITWASNADDGQLMQVVGSWAYTAP